MRINIHDTFKSWRHFIDTAKRLYRFLGQYNLEIKSMCIYATLCNKDTKKVTTLNVYDKDGNFTDEVGFDIGYFEWENHSYEGMTLRYALDESLLNQKEYRSKRNAACKQRDEEALRCDFENNYLPVTKTTPKGRNKRTYNSVADLEKLGYDYRKIKKAIDENKTYRDYIWVKSETFLKTLDKVESL